MLYFQRCCHIDCVCLIFALRRDATPVNCPPCSVHSLPINADGIKLSHGVQLGSVNSCPGWADCPGPDTTKRRRQPVRQRQRVAVQCHAALYSKSLGTGFAAASDRNGGRRHCICHTQLSYEPALNVQRLLLCCITLAAAMLVTVMRS